MREDDIKLKTTLVEKMNQLGIVVAMVSDTLIMLPLMYGSGHGIIEKFNACANIINHMNCQDDDFKELNIKIDLLKGYEDENTNK